MISVAFSAQCGSVRLVWQSEISVVFVVNGACIIADFDKNNNVLYVKTCI